MPGPDELNQMRGARRLAAEFTGVAQRVERAIVREAAECLQRIDGDGELERLSPVFRERAEARFLSLCHRHEVPTENALPLLRLLAEDAALRSLVREVLSS